VWPLVKMASSADSRAARAAPAFAIEPMSAATRLALDVCRLHDRDAVLEELKGKIAAQAKEIAVQAREIARQDREICNLRRRVGVCMGPVWEALYEARGLRPEWNKTQSEQPLHRFLRRGQRRVSAIERAVLKHVPQFPYDKRLDDSDDSEEEEVVISFRL